MTLKNLRYAIVGLSAVAATLPGMKTMAQAPAPTVPPLPILATFPLTNSTYATFQSDPGSTKVASVAPTTLATSLQSAVLTIPQAGPGAQTGTGMTTAQPDPGSTFTKIQPDNGYGIVLSVIPSNQTYTVGGIDYTATSDAGALVVGSYFTLNLTGKTGTPFTVATLQFDAGKGGPSDPRGYDIRSSVDNYSSSIDTTTLPSGNQTALITDTVNLFGNANYQNLSAVTFRFYIWTPNTSGGTVDFRNITVSSAPEPGDFALLLIGLAPMALVLRRRQRKARAQA